MDFLYIFLQFSIKKKNLKKKKKRLFGHYLKLTWFHIGPKDEEKILEF